MKRLPVLPLRSYIIAACAAALTVAACRTSFQTTSQRDFLVANRRPDVEHGERLTMAACGSCHANPETGLLTGKHMEDLPRPLGKVYSSNITASQSHGAVAAYSDGELAHLLRTGVARDGRFLSYMLRPNISDNDMQDIIAFLRRGTGAAAPTHIRAGVTRLTPAGKMAFAMMAKPASYRPSVAAPRTQTDSGRYLVDNIGCFHCHSKSLTSINYQVPEHTRGYLAGGARFKNSAGVVRGANITMDTATGIGRYTREEFRNAVQHRIARGGRAMRPPTDNFTLTDAECDAIFAYIHTLPAKRHKVKGQPQYKG